MLAHSILLGSALWSFFVAGTPRQPQANAKRLDLAGARIVVPSGGWPVYAAKEMLADEVLKRTQLRLWDMRNVAPQPSPLVLIGEHHALRELELPAGVRLPEPKGPRTPDGFRIAVLATAPHPVVAVIGNDPRGVLFGVGRLLRELRMSRGMLVLPASTDIESAPEYPLRGHQLGYRPKTNSYDGWDLATWKQYYRDLVVFGANAVELIPPRSDDDASSPHFPMPPMPMMVEMSRLAEQFGLDVWVWYPALDKDYSNRKAVEAAIEEWTGVLKQLPRLDAVFVPGGDPGHTPPKVLMPFLQKQAAAIRLHHPRAQMWVSPQGFTAAWMEDFLEILNREQPDWLTGVVFGPQVRMPLSDLRKMVPAKYPIRHYPDITHSLQCQYPVPDWDVAFALTEAREGINPRPLDQARIFRATQTHTNGFITYSEGCNDDVNKAVWSALGWDSKRRPLDILREYSRYFFGPEIEEDAAQGILELEANWRGPLAKNPSIERTLLLFRDLERNASPALLRNWRFQQLLYRAYYDAFLRERLLRETAAERKALAVLGRARQGTTLSAIALADRVLDRSKPSVWESRLRSRVFELGEALFQSIHMQLSVEKYWAIEKWRGANLDTIDVPLGNKPWIRDRLDAARGRKTEKARFEDLREIVEWQNPGPGGYYDDLGDPRNRPHLAERLPIDRDPGTYATWRTAFDDPMPRLSWSRHAETLYDTPLELSYAGLDPKANYAVRVVYSVEWADRPIRLTAGNGVEVHPLLTKPNPHRRLEFKLPRETYRNGKLNLRWTNEGGMGRNGRAVQVCEVWVVRR